MQQETPNFKFYWMKPQSLPHTSVMSQGLLRYEKPYSYRSEA
jgi:hypothetical protein